MYTASYEQYPNVWFACSYWIDKITGAITKFEDDDITVECGLHHKKVRIDISLNCSSCSMKELCLLTNSIADTELWNNLPVELRQRDIVLEFRRLLKNVDVFVKFCFAELFCQ